MIYQQEHKAAATAGWRVERGTDKDGTFYELVSPDGQWRGQPCLGYQSAWETLPKDWRKKGQTQS